MRISPRSSPSSSPPRPFGLDPVVAGTICCIASALLYTLTNICLRRLAVDCDRLLVNCVKELVTVVAVGPWLLVKVFRGRRFLPPPRMLALLIATGLVVQLLGNLSVLWAYGVEGVGLAITTPAVFAAMLTGSAVLGYVCLGERVSTRSWGAIGLLIVAIGLLGKGALAATGASLAAAGPILLGVAAGCLAGLTFALLGAVVRHASTHGVRVSTIVFLITGTGVVAFGVLSLTQVGLQKLLETPPVDFRWMLAAGASNLLAFLLITKGLQLTTLARANMLNASQVALGASAGILFFGESSNLWSVFGIVLTVLGLALVGRPPAAEQEGCPL